MFCTSDGGKSLLVYFKIVPPSPTAQPKLGFIKKIAFISWIQYSGTVVAVRVLLIVICFKYPDARPR